MYLTYILGGIWMLLLFGDGKATGGYELYSLVKTLILHFTS